MAGKLLVVMSFIKRFLINTVAGLCGPFRAAYTHRSLLRLLIRRDIAIRTSGTVLGGVWMVLQPALQVLALWFLIGVVLRVRFPGMVPFLDYFLIGMVPWLMLFEVMTRNLSVLSEFGTLYQRTAFPVAVLPVLPSLVAGAVYGAIYFGVVIALEGIAVAPMALVVLLLLLIWVLPVGYLLSVLGLFLKDAGNAVSFILTLTMYLTPILYLPEMVPEVARPWLILNPFADVMAVIHGVLQDMPFDKGNVLRPLAFWLLLLAPAWVLFRRSEPHMREAL